MKRYLLAATIALLASAWAPAEDFRVQLLAMMEVDPANPEGMKANLSFADGVAVLLPEDRSFLAGVELELRIPAAVQARPENFLEYLYRSVRPAPSRSAVAYSGSTLHWQVLPARVSHVIQIPLGPDSGLKAGPYATLLPSQEASSFPLVFRLMPSNKGLTEDMEKAVFQLRVRPLLRDEGRLRLSFVHGPGVPANAALELSVDGAVIAEPLEPMILKAGRHDLRLSGPDVRDEFRSFTIEQARELPLQIALQDVTPRLILEYPERSRVELDGKPLADDARGEQPGIPLSPGDHIITFLVGDYSLQRRITVQRGRTYRVSLLIDMSIEEE